MPGLVSVSRADRIAAGAHLDGSGDPREPRQPLRPSRAGNDPQLHFRLSDQRSGNGHAIMAGHGGFQAAPERRAVDRGDDGLGRFLNAVQDGVEARPAPALAAGSHFPELSDVRAGDKGPAAANQHDRLHGIVFVELLYSAGNSFRHSRAQSVHRRIIYGQDTDVAVSADQH